MRGYLDGDGSVYYNKENDIRISVNSTKEFCDVYLKKLPYYGEAKVYREKRSKKNVHYICIGGQKQVRLIYNFLYKNSTVQLDRKMNKFVHFYNEKDRC